jgi:glycosyltransferase involved in cell wall biosynthesis
MGAAMPSTASEPRPDLSVVLPAFNEAENIDAAVGRCLDVAARLAIEVEVLVVDDGSCDATAERVAAWTARDARVRMVRHPSNLGYGAALRSGLTAAEGTRVFFTDADLQFDLTELDGLLARSDEADILAGYRAPRRDPWHRCLNGWLWSRLVDLLFSTGVRDVDCAFKLFHRDVLAHVPIRSMGAFVNTEILVRARAAGFRVVEVPVKHLPRVAGRATGADPRVIVRAFVELASLWVELRALVRRGPEGTTRPARQTARTPGGGRPS